MAYLKPLPSQCSCSFIQELLSLFPLVDKLFVKGGKVDSCGLEAYPAHVCSANLYCLSFKAF